MNNLSIFAFESAAVRTLDLNGEPWFVATDIAKILGFKVAKDMTRMLDDDEKGGHIVPTLGGDQEVTIINESGLYACILKSRRTEAKAFRKWVTGEVLPSIRKRGNYSAPCPDSPAPQFTTHNLSHGADLAVAAERTFRSFIRAGRTAGLPFPQALRIANEQTIARTGMDMLSQLSINPDDVAVDLAAKQKPINPVDPEIDALMLSVSSWAEKADPDRFYCMDEIVAEVAGVKFNSHRGRSFACRIGPMLKRAGFRSKRAYLMDMQRNVWYRG